MAKKVIMPKFEMAQETGTVSKWLRNEGDPVEQGEAILEIETDKVTMEVEAPASGILAGIRAKPGKIIPIGQVIAYILKPGETLPDEESSQPKSAAIAAPAGGPAGTQPRATPTAKRIAKFHGFDLQTILPAESKGRVTKADVEGYLTSQAVDAPLPGKVRAVPAARRLARELGVNLDAVSGNGPQDRIQSADVREVAATISQPDVSATLTKGQPAIRRTVPLTGTRAIIANRMIASVRDAPQFTVSLEVVMGRALAVIDDLQAVQAGDESTRVTLTAFLVKACAWTLSRFSAVNAAFANDNILEWADINIGVAVAFDEGLIVPVIYQADTLDIRAIAARLADLSRRTRAGQLRPEDVRGGTFTISNLGMFGVDRFTAILNPPQAAILAVGRVAKRPTVTDDDRLEIQSTAELTLTADHRVIDGALAGRFLADLKQAIERPGVLL